MADLKKVLVVSEYAPPNIEGIPIQMGNLLRYFPKGSYAIFTHWPENSRFFVDPDTKLDAQYFFFRTDYFCNVKFLRRQDIQPIIAFLTVPFLVVRIIVVVKKGGYSRILAPNNDGPFFVSAFLASLLLKVPLYSFFYDVYSEILTNRFNSLMAKLFEPKIIRHSKKIFVTSEAMGDYYKAKYGRDSILIPHSFDDHLPSKIKNIQSGRKIVLTGAIGRGDDRLECLLEAIKEMPDVELDLYVPTKRNLNINLPNVKVAYATRGEIPDILSSADILLLTRNFYTFLSEVIALTGCPSRLADYLGSGKPILILAPENSYISNYAKIHGFALVLNELNPIKLKQYIYNLLNDNVLRQKIIKNIEIIKEKHRASTISLKLQKALFEQEYELTK